MTSNDKSAKYLIEDPLYVTSYFPLAVFKILSLAVDSLIMCLSMDFSGFFLLRVMKLLEFMSFFKFGTFSTTISPYNHSASFSVSSSETPIRHKLFHLMAFHKSPMVRAFLFILFPCFSDSILLFFYLCIFIICFYFWLCWVFVAACGLSLVAASVGYSLLPCVGFLIAVVSPVAEHGL